MCFVSRPLSCVGLFSRTHGILIFWNEVILEGIIGLGFGQKFFIYQFSNVPYQATEHWDWRRTQF